MMKRILFLLAILLSANHSWAFPPSPPVSGAITTHSAASDPHTGYMLESNIGTGASNYVQLTAAAKLSAGLDSPAIAKKSAAYTVGTDDPRECYGGIIYVTSAATITACDNLADGMNFTVLTVGAIAVSVDPQNDDLMVLDGTALTDGQAATNTSTAGDIATCSYYDATGWYCATNAWTGP